MAYITTYRIFHKIEWSRFSQSPVMLWEFVDKDFDTEQDALDYMENSHCECFTILKAYKCENC